MPMRRVRFNRTSSEAPMVAPVPPRRRDSLPRPCRFAHPERRAITPPTRLGLPLAPPVIHAHESKFRDFLHLCAASNDRAFFARNMVQLQNQHREATIHQVTYSPAHLLDLPPSPVRNRLARPPPLIFPMVVEDQFYAIICVPAVKNLVTIAVVTTLPKLPSWVSGDLLHQLLDRHGVPGDAIKYGRLDIPLQGCIHQNMPSTICAIYRWLKKLRPVCVPVDFDAPQHRQGSFSDLCQYFDSLW